MLVAPSAENRDNSRVTEAEFFERFDRHLERGNALIGEVRHEVALTREEVRRSRDAHEDLRTFTRDITTRNEKVWRGVMDRLDDMGEEIRAQTAAILNVLDRLEGTS